MSTAGTSVVMSPGALEAGSGAAPRDTHSDLWLLSLGSNTYVPRDVHRDVHSRAVLGGHDQEATLLSLDRKMGTCPDTKHSSEVRDLRPWETRRASSVRGRGHR